MTPDGIHRGGWVRFRLRHGLQSGEGGRSHRLRDRDGKEDHGRRLQGPRVF